MTIGLKNLPGHFPEMEFPVENEYSEARVQLGKFLFYSKMLSSDYSVSCASCHAAEHGFGANTATSPGVFNRPGVRNAPTLTNIGYHPYFTREGGVPTLEMQVLVPAQEHNEFDLNILDAVERFKADSLVQSMSQKAYGKPLDYKVLMRSIAMFERTLVSKNSAFDRYAFQGDKQALKTDELAGLRLFYSARTNCFKCHGGFNFTTYGFENNGLYEVYADEGRKRLTGLPEDEARYKVPTLRNIEVTAPYMHDGSLSTLDEVIDHYDSGGRSHPQKSEWLKPLHLTPMEKDQLKAFLLTLTDHEFMNNPKFRN